MFNNLKKKIAIFICPEIFSESEKKEKHIDMMINQRVADYLLKMDPFEPLLKKFHGIFTEEFEHPEQKLDERSKLGLMTWAYQQKADPSFKYLTDWISNTQGRETLTRPVLDPVLLPSIMLYGRAQISTMMLFTKEVGRLSNLYQEELERRKQQPEIDPGVAVE